MAQVTMSHEKAGQSKLPSTILRVQR